jgi:hypothetical protein
VGNYVVKHWELEMVQITGHRHLIGIAQKLHKSKLVICMRMEHPQPRYQQGTTMKNDNLVVTYFLGDVID